MHLEISMSVKETYKKIQDWNYRIGERMKRPAAIPEVVHEHHICSHCGYSFDGRCCPQCGLQAGHERFTFKRLTSNFLDIWGFGSRSMFRSIRDLLWRPGYLIRDYLSGHHLSYFPPFKMLAVLTILIAFLAWIFNLQDPLVGKNIAELLHKIPAKSRFSAFALDYIGNVIVYLDKYDLYRILLQNVLVVFAAWIVFHNKGFNLVETFFSQIYINCQFHLIALLWMLIFRELPPTASLPYYVPVTIAFLVLIFDYKQLYGLTFKQSIWRTILFHLLVLVFYFILFLVVLIIVLLGDEIAV